MVTGADATHIATFAGGQLRYQSDTTSPSLNVSRNIGSVAGKTYEVSITIASRTSGTMKTDFSGVGHSFPTVPGIYTTRLVAASAAFNVTRATVNVDISISRISVREVL